MKIKKFNEVYYPLEFTADQIEVVDVGQTFIKHEREITIKVDGKEYEFIISAFGLEDDTKIFPTSNDFDVMAIGGESQLPFKLTPELKDEIVDAWIDWQNNNM